MKVNPTNEKFLFAIPVESIALQSACGCSLKTGCQIIAVLFLLSAVTNLFGAFAFYSLISTIMSLFYFSVFFIAGYYLLYSTWTFIPKQAYVAYFIYAIIFIWNFIEFILIILMIILGFYYPYGVTNLSTFQIILLYSITVSIYLAIHLYLIWIIFSFYVHILNNREHLVKGHIYDVIMEYEYTRRHPVEETMQKTQ